MEQLQQAIHVMENASAEILKSFTAKSDALLGAEIVISAREAASLKREKEVTKREENVAAAVNAAQTLASERLCKIKTSEQRIDFQEKKIETLRKEKGVANAQVASLQKRVAELELALGGVTCPSPK
jgi:hypothetical protein